MPVQGRYIRLRALRNTQDSNDAGYAEIDVITDAESHKPLSINEGPYRPTTESLQRYRYPEWFRDAKFGIWAHWGPQAVPRHGDWYARRMYQQGDKDYKFHLDHYGHPSRFGYKDIIPLWKAEKWDPEKLMALYKKAGAKYFVSMGSHHDNFYLWDSKIHHWNAVQMGPHKDVVGLWQKAAQKYGLRFGVSEHLAASYTWFQPAHSADTSGPYKGVPYDGNEPQYADLYHTKAAPGDKGWLTSDTGWPKEWFNVVKELVDSYHPDLLYSDSELPFGVVGRSMLANFYNGNLAYHNGEMTAVYNCKQPSQGMWVQDLERGVQDSISPYPWQTDTSIGDWFYSMGQEYKSATNILRMLVDIVSKNGNLLINIVQTPEGDLEPDMLNTLDDIGKWTAINGEGIYGSRPWKIFGEHPAGATVKAGNFNEDRIKYTAEDIRFTTNGNKLYAFLLDVPASDIRIRSLGKRSEWNTQRIRSVVLLGGSEKLKWRQENDALVIKRPASLPDWKVLCFRIELVE
jgi:alpha-L-fucosidase